MIVCMYFFTTICSCGDSDRIKIQIDDLIVEGEISADTVFNGLIRFYNSETGALERAANYNQGVLDGERKDYHTNGRIKLKMNYSDGKANGNLYVYDSTGELQLTQIKYYDVRVGPSIEYKENRISKYYFYSFGNIELIHIDYDSINKSQIAQLNDSTFFFWNILEFSTPDSKTPRTNLFLYLPNPPKINFKYSICILGANYRIKEILQEFNDGESFSEFELDFGQLKDDETFAIRLVIDNTLNDETITMFKKIKYGS